MKSALLFSLFALLLAAFACGGKSEHEKVAEDSLNIMEEMTRVLSGITDEASAKAAAPEIEKLAAEMQTFINKMEELGEFTGEVDPEVAAEYQQRSVKISQDFGKEMMRVMQIEGAWDAVGQQLGSMSAPGAGK